MNLEPGEQGMHCWMVPDDIYVSFVKTKIAGNIKNNES